MSNTATPNYGAISVKDFCLQFGIGLTTYYTNRKKGLYPPIRKVGKRSLILLSDIDDWVDGLRSDQGEDSQDAA